MSVLPYTIGSTAYAGTHVLYTALRGLLSYVMWAVSAAFVAAAVCYCCGWGCRAAWARIGPSPHAGRRLEPGGPDDGAATCDLAPADDAGREAARGIDQLEAYLASGIEPRETP